MWAERKVGQVLSTKFGPVTIVFFIILFTIWILRRRKHFNSFVKLGIPGPKPNLLLGNMWELYWKGPLSCLQRWIDQHGKVFIYFFGMRPVLVVMDLDLLKEIQIKDFMDFADRPVLLLHRVLSLGFLGLFELDPPKKPGEPINDFLIFLRGTRWKRVRSVITPSFTTLKLKTMAQTMDESINDLLKNIEEYSRQENYIDRGNLDYLYVHKLRYLDQVFSECLRVYPPVFLHITYGSIQIMKGTTVQVPVYHLHHNPAQVQNSSVEMALNAITLLGVFSVDNHDHHPLAWQPFGHGPRNCIGMRFAQLEAKMAISRIVQKYYLMPCEKTEKVTITEYIFITSNQTHTFGLW
ncbi:cytochrome P450 6g1-like [Tachypleus tridentatus]|uniref:cytochrome P450 6g1-like n=1 Tax=Tachypleus tridentatus TaxID=6853 RepID=UPI003FD55D50